MSVRIGLTSVIIDDAVYPRAKWYERAVQRYAEALAAEETLPAIAIEEGTNRLIDGMHRWRAHEAAGLADIAVEYVTVPDSVPIRLFAAQLNARHGLPLSDEDQQALARELYEADESLDVAAVARAFGKQRRTVQNWLAEQVAGREARRERERQARACAAAILREMGWSARQVGTLFNVDHKTVLGWGGNDTSPPQLEEASLRAGLDLLPTDVRTEAEEVAQQWREDRMFATWSAEERGLLKRLNDGETTLVNYHKHKGLIAYCEGAGILVRIDRRSDWGNPFEMPADGDRATVIANYRDHYLPYKPSLHRKMGNLAGMALACWCAPDPCHGDVLLEASQ